MLLGLKNLLGGSKRVGQGYTAFRLGTTPCSIGIVVVSSRNLPGALSVPSRIDSTPFSTRKSAVAPSKKYEANHHLVS